MSDYVHIDDVCMQSLHRRRVSCVSGSFSDFDKVIESRVKLNLPSNLAQIACEYLHKSKTDKTKIALTNVTRATYSLADNINQVQTRVGKVFTRVFEVNDRLVHATFNFPTKINSMIVSFVVDQHKCYSLFNLGQFSVRGSKKKLKTRHHKNYSEILNPDTSVQLKYELQKVPNYNESLNLVFVLFGTALRTIDLTARTTHDKPYLDAITFDTIETPKK